MVVIDARIMTMDPLIPGAQALAVVAAEGSDTDIRGRAAGAAGVGAGLCARTGTAAGRESRRPSNGRWRREPGAKARVMVGGVVLGFIGKGGLVCYFTGIAVAEFRHGVRHRREPVDTA